MADDDYDLTRGLNALLADAPAGENPARALREPPRSIGRGSMESGDASTFREPTLVNTVLGRYSPSGMLSSAWNPQTRESAAWQRKVGTMLDEGLGLPALVAAPFMVGSGVRGGLAAREASRSAKAAEGPWGNPRMLDDMLDARGPLPARHELNKPVAAEEKPFTPMSAEQLDAEYQALINEGRAFVRPRPREMLGDAVYNPLTGKWTGHMEPRAGNQGRWSHSETPDSNYLESWSRSGPYHTGPTPAQALAEDVLRFGKNNENIPGLYNQAEALARRLQGIGAKHGPHRQANYKNYFGFEDVIGDRYLDDVSRRLGGNPNSPFEGARFGNARPMEQDDLHRILKTDFGADPKNPESVKKAYADFWKEEQRRLWAGQPTIHDEEALIQKKMQDNATRQRFGLEPDNPKNKKAIRDAWDKELADMMGKVGEARKGAERRMRGLPDLENNPTMKSIADNVLQYGPPAAVGGYAGHQLGGMYRDFAHDNWESRGGRERSLRLPYPPDPNKP